MSETEEITNGGQVPEAPKTPEIMTTQSAPVDILADAAKEDANYTETDVFAWANNLVQFKDELKIDLFLFNKNFTMYKAVRSPVLDKQMEPLFIDGLLEYVLEGADMGLIVRGFEDAEAEKNVLQRTRLKNVDKARELLNWLKTQESSIEMFSEEDHDIKRIKGVVARVRHDGLKQSFYVIKALQQSQVIKGKTGWMIRDGKMIPFDADAALRIPTDNQLLVLDQDMYVFSQPKLKSLFGYDAKESFIAAAKVREIEANYRLSFSEGLTLQNLVKDNKSIIKKLQMAEPGLVTQEKMIEHADDIGINLMSDDSGAIIIIDEKDMIKFVNLMNDDYMESPTTGLRYEVKSKKVLKPIDDEEDLLKQMLN
jgi:hypothetical protein